MDPQRPWHRLFGLSWMDFFRGLPVTVELEKDLSLRKQLLDVLFIYNQAGVLPCRLPDGFDNLATYNLVSFKSFQEVLSYWTLLELLGHFVNLRKQVSPSMDEDDLLPWEMFRLYAVSVRYPQNLVSSGVPLRPIQQGVYEVEALTQPIRLIVVNQLPETEHNALLHLFGAKAEQVRYGAQHYQIRSLETSTLLTQLFQRYRQEILTMPDLLEEFARETIDQILKDLPWEKRLQGAPVEKRLEGVPVEKRLEGLSVDEQLAALSPQAKEELLRRLKAEGATGSPP